MSQQSKDGASSCAPATVQVCNYSLHLRTVDLTQTDGKEADRSTPRRVLHFPAGRKSQAPTNPLGIDPGLSAPITVADWVAVQSHPTAKHLCKSKNGLPPTLCLAPQG